MRIVAPTLGLGKQALSPRATLVPRSVLAQIPACPEPSAATSLGWLAPGLWPAEAARDLRDFSTFTNSNAEAQRSRRDLVSGKTQPPTRSAATQEMHQNLIQCCPESLTPVRPHRGRPQRSHKPLFIISNMKTKSLICRTVWLVLLCSAGFVTGCQNPSPHHGHSRAAASSDFDRQTERTYNPVTRSFEGQPPFGARSNQ